jgi:ribosome assembly protein YihI (activator of Der GTPase)
MMRTRIAVFLFAAFFSTDFTARAQSAAGGTTAVGEAVQAMLRQTGESIDPEFSPGRNEKFDNLLLDRLERLLPLTDDERRIADRPVDRPAELLFRLGLDQGPRRTIDLRERSPSARDIVEGLKR